MRPFQVIAALVLIAGAVFLLQGLRVLPSAVMYGKPEWIAIGGVMVVVSLAILFFTSR